MIQEEAERLNRFIANLLDMTRLESGAVQSRNETVDIGDVVGSALQRATAVLAQHSIQLKIEAGLPMRGGDPVLLEQVLFNLLDNAAKYTPAQSAITLTARRDDGRIALQVADEGPGLPDDDARAHVRQVLPCACRRQSAGGHRPWPCDLPRLRRSDGRHDHRRQSHGTRGAVFTIMLPAARQVES